MFISGSNITTQRWKTDDDESDHDGDDDDHGGQLLESEYCDGFTEDILESSDVLIKSKLLSLSQVICWSCSNFRLNAVGQHI